MGTVYFDIFPHSLLLQAKLASEAWWEVLTDDVAHVAFVDADGTPTPRITLFDDRLNDDGCILMAGGPGALMSECPEFGCLAWIMDRDGRVVHTWEVNQGELWVDAPNAGIIAHQRIYADVILVLSPEGETVGEISVFDLLAAHDYLGAAYPRAMLATRFISTKWSTCPMTVRV